jgi:hypothetical protein
VNLLINTQERMSMVFYFIRLIVAFLIHVCLAARHQVEHESPHTNMEEIPFSNQNSNFNFLQRKTKVPIIHNENIEAVSLLQEGLQFISNIQNPSNCTGQKYMITDIGIPGGFASQFQLAAAIWMRMLAETNFEMPILIKGKLIGYSEGKECSKYDNEWTCFFLPTSTCQKELLSTGVLVKDHPKTLSNDESIPIQFQKHGLMLWWSIIQSYLFRFQPYMQNYLLASTQQMSNSRSFPYGLPMAGVHVRHGDKKIDSWREFSLQEELHCLTTSKDCHHSVNNSCFYAFNLTNYYSNILLLKALHNQTMILKESDLLTKIDWNGSHSLVDHSVSAKDLLKWKKKYYGYYLFHSVNSNDPQESEFQTHGPSHPHHYHHHQEHHNLFFSPFLTSTILGNSTSTSENVTAIKEFINNYDKLNELTEMKSHPLYHHYLTNQHHQKHYHQLHSENNNNTTTPGSEGSKSGSSSSQQSSDETLSELEHIKKTLVSEKYVIPLDVFIASDDGEVIKYSQQMGFFVNKEGVSQQTHGAAMIALVIKHRESSFEASLQIISDIFLLSQCSTLIGMAASQVFRMAVGMSYARGTLKYVKAIDYSAINKIRQMSNKYKLPFPETFSP